MAAQKKKRPFKGLGLEHMNSHCPVLPAQFTRSDLRSSKFQVMDFSFARCTLHKLLPNLIDICYLCQTEILCLRERDLLGRFAAEVSRYQAQGESKEYAVILVRVSLTVISFPVTVSIHSSYQVFLLLCSLLLLQLFPSYQSYQLAEDLARAFTDRAIFQIFLEAEMTSSGPLKVNLDFPT